MAIFVDLFMAAFLLLALVLGIRQGFVQSLARVAIVIVALLGAAWLAQQLAEPAAEWLEPILTEKIQQRLETARREAKEIVNYDYIVVNDTVDRAVGEILAILIAEGCRKERRLHLVEGV